MTAIKERPIIFSSPMVNAIREGRKTMTRRIVKLRDFGPDDTPGYDWIFRDRRSLWNSHATDDLIVKHCPHGRVGDRLWVKEGLWAVLPNVGDTTLVTAYNTDGELALDGDRRPVPWRWKKTTLPSIFMPRWASRVLLEITDVKVERLNDISEADAIAEGARGWLDSLNGRAYDNAEKQACRFTKIIDPQAGVMSGRGVFAALWESINGEGSWAANPWLWAITFRRIDA